MHCIGNSRFRGSCTGRVAVERGIRCGETTCNLVVLADGGSSFHRNEMGIAVDLVDYDVGYQTIILEKPFDVDWGRHYPSPEGFVGLFPMPVGLLRAAVELTTEGLKEWLSYDKVLERTTESEAALCCGSSPR